MKLVGKPDAGNRHVRFDERGQETERCHMAQATAPVLDSTCPPAPTLEDEIQMIDPGLTRQTIYRIKDDPKGAEAALATWAM